MTERDLTVAVTGPTGTFGSGLIPLLQADDRVGRIVGVARRPLDPAVYGWTKMTSARGCPRTRCAAGGVRPRRRVVHLAFQVTGNAPGEVIRAVNVDGTLNAFRAAAAAGARRFVYASSVAAYGFHPDNPIGHDRGLGGAPRHPAVDDGRRPSSSRCCGPRQAGPEARPGPAAPAGGAGSARRRRQGTAAGTVRAVRPLAGRAGRAGAAAGARAGPGAAASVRARAGPGPGVRSVHRGRRVARGVQRRRRRDPHRRRRGPGIRPIPLPIPGGPGAVRGAGHGGAAVPAARRAMGGGGPAIR